MIENPEYNRKTKHISIKYHKTWRLINNWTVPFKLISKAKLVADSITKSLKAFKLKYFFSILDLVNLYDFLLLGLLRGVTLNPGRYIPRPVHSVSASSYIVLWLCYSFFVYRGCCFFDFMPSYLKSAAYFFLASSFSIVSSWLFSQVTL